MGKRVTAYKVDRLNNIKTDRYTEGSIFITNRSIGILTNGTIKTIPTNLKDYVKKDDVYKMIDERLKEVNHEK